MTVYGIQVQKDEDGYFWRQGPDGGGYFDTSTECVDDIKRACAADAAHEAEIYGTRYDTPSLPQPWFASR